MNKNKTIVFCGGGSGGHVIPALTLIESLKERDKDINFIYIGSYTGIESNLVPDRGISYQGISTGKLRRYLSIQNLTDIGRIFKGVFQSLSFLFRLKRQGPVLVFTTGGFVTVPVAIAAWLLRLPILLHEQTSRAGLANRIVGKLATKVYISFHSSKEYFPIEKTSYSGYPIRDEFFIDNNSDLIIKGRMIGKDRPILFLTGGGNGSALLNSWLNEYRVELSRKYLIIHQIGAHEFEKYKDFEDESYLPLTFLGSEIIELMKRSAIIISRSGAGTVCELLAIGKRSILVPLKIAQKNEQYYNAMEAVSKLNSLLIEEDQVKTSNLVEVIEKFESEQSMIVKSAQDGNAVDYLCSEITSMIKAKT
jgi:UDP-N-acetylglucosamine--N-acetylmuramyl-(pentapeptide) pyrophosphoryl-undecaprenol N-acetylglucosamine transferase